MKQKFLATVLATLTLCFSLVGCSGGSLYRCIDAECTSCLANMAECTGCLVDCGDCTLSCFLGEECTDTCLVAPCYQCAGCIRNGNTGSSTYAAKLFRDTDPLNQEDYYVTAGCSQSAITNIENLDRYFKLTVSVTVESWVTLKDVVVDFSVADNYGNQMNHACLYIADCIEPEDSDGQTQSATFTFYRSGEMIEDFSHNVSDTSSLSFLEDGNNEYIVKVTVNSVHGRY